MMMVMAVMVEALHLSATLRANPGICQPRRKVNVEKLTIDSHPLRRILQRVQRGVKGWLGFELRIEEQRPLWQMIVAPVILEIRRVVPAIRIDQSPCDDSGNGGQVQSDRKIASKNLGNHAVTLGKIGRGSAIIHVKFRDNDLKPERGYVFKKFAEARLAKVAKLFVLEMRLNAWALNRRTRALKLVEQFHHRSAPRLLPRNVQFHVILVIKQQRMWVRRA